MASEVWYWLGNGLGWGAVNSGELLTAYPGGAEAVLANLGSERLDDILTQKQADRLASTRPEDFSLRIRHAEADGIVTLGYDDARYPATLRNINNPPLVLFVKGDLALLNGQLAIGMVGARRPSAYGVEAVKAIGRGVALGGAIIVSGLAAGLDAEAHKAALAVNGPTIACIAFGHDTCYPAANRKLMEVIERHGAVVSEYPLGTKPEKPFFLQRNRIIAGISHGLVVVEARSHSGTMSTVNFAVDFGRDVFAVPGSIFSELSGGTNSMLKEGAYVASSASDVLEVYGIELKVEDPVKQAAKQAAEGRPAPAGAAAPWHQGLNRFSERAKYGNADSEPSEQLPGQQSLGELLRSQLGDTGGAEVTAAQAVSAFRALQSKLPAATESELDARNRALDEMVEAVSDSVDISQSARAKAQREQPKPEGPQPYPWHQLERIDKSEMEANKSKQNRARRQSFASRLQNGLEEANRKLEPARQEAPAPVIRPEVTPEPPLVQQRPAASQVGQAFSGASVGRVEAVDRIEPIGAASGPRPVAPVAAAPASPVVQPIPAAATAQAAPAPPAASRPKPGRAANVDEVDIFGSGRSGPSAFDPQPKKAGAQPPQEFVPVPAADRPQSTPKPDNALAGRLKTLQEKPPRQTERRQAQPRLSAPRGGAPAPATTDGGLLQPESLLSDSAKRALEQLGPTPAPLSLICERSGLSSAEAMAALTELELAGLSRQLPGRQFVAG